MSNYDYIEYRDAIRFIPTQFFASNLGWYLPPELVFGDDDVTIIKMRNFIDRCFTKYNGKVPDNINEKMDLILQHELSQKKITIANSLPKTNKYNISLWKGDITELAVDCIVNAANSRGLGCFKPDHKCIDNVIHNKAGPRMREECRINLNSKMINPGDLILTRGYNLPATYVFHTVGPIYEKKNHKDNQITLSKCYLNCLTKLRDIKKYSIAFCCISTGEYGYPKDEASEIAVRSVIRWIDQFNYPVHIVFNVFTKEDLEIYQKCFKRHNLI